MVFKTFLMGFIDSSGKKEQMKLPKLPSSIIYEVVSKLWVCLYSESGVVFQLGK